VWLKQGRFPCNFFNGRAQKRRKVNDATG